MLLLQLCLVLRARTTELLLCTEGLLCVELTKMAGDFPVFLYRTHPHSKLLTGSLDVKMVRLNTIQVHFKCFKIAGPWENAGSWNWLV